MKKIIIALLIVCSLIVTVSPLYATGTVVQLRGIWIQDIGGSPLIGLNRPLYVDSVVLTANVAATYTLPTGAKYALFSANADFYVAYSGTAAVPSSSITNGTAPELNPVLRQVDDLTSVSLISPNSCIITIAIYK